MNILITGTTQGIGRELTDRLRANRTHKVYTVNRREVTDEYNIVCDLSKIKQVDELCKRIGRLQIDVLINNAGGSFPKAFGDLTSDDIVERMNLNYVAPVLLMKAVIPHMLEQRYGQIINISSVTAKTPVPFLHIYGAAKAALDNTMRSTAVYYSNSGIRINNICPGSVNTYNAVINRGIISNLHGKGSCEYQDEMEESNGLGRMIQPEEIVDVIMFMLSDASSAVNGQSINVCGTMEVH